jgi:hypothetical protein
VEKLNKFIFSLEEVKSRLAAEDDNFDEFDERDELDETKELYELDEFEEIDENIEILRKSAALMDGFPPKSLAIMEAILRMLDRGDSIEWAARTYGVHVKVIEFWIEEKERRKEFRKKLIGYINLKEQTTENEKKNTAIVNKTSLNRESAAERRKREEEWLNSTREIAIKARETANRERAEKEKARKGRRNKSGENSRIKINSLAMWKEYKEKGDYSRYQLDYTPKYKKEIAEKYKEIGYIGLEKDYGVSRKLIETCVDKYISKPVVGSFADLSALQIQRAKGEERQVAEYTEDFKKGIVGALELKKTNKSDLDFKWNLHYYRIEKWQKEYGAEVLELIKEDKRLEAEGKPKVFEQLLEKIMIGYEPRARVEKVVVNSFEDLEVLKLRRDAGEKSLIGVYDPKFKMEVVIDLKLNKINKNKLRKLGIHPYMVKEWQEKYGDKAHELIEAGKKLEAEGKENIFELSEIPEPPLRKKNTELINTIGLKEPQTIEAADIIETDEKVEATDKTL